MPEFDTKNTATNQQEPDKNNPGKSPWPFDNLPVEIHDWLISDEVDTFVRDLTAKNTDSIPDKRALGFTITWLAIGKINANQFVGSLINAFKISPEIAKTLAKEVRDGVLKPIKFAMRSKLGIDIEHVTDEPGVIANGLIMDIRKPVAAAPTPTARVIPMSRPVAGQSTVSRSTVSQPGGGQPQIKAGVIQPTKPIGLSEVVPQPPGGTGNG